MSAGLDLRLVEVGADAAARLAAAHAEAFARPWSATEFADLFAGHGIRCLAAEDGAGEMLGFVLTRIAVDEVEILTLAVRPAARRHGIARALVEAAAELGRGAGARLIWLEVSVDNVAAVGLYRSAGFERTGVHPNYYAGRTDALVMRRVLNTGPT